MYYVIIRDPKLTKLGNRSIVRRRIAKVDRSRVTQDVAVKKQKQNFSSFEPTQLHPRSSIHVRGNEKVIVVREDQDSQFLFALVRRGFTIQSNVTPKIVRL